MFFTFGRYFTSLTREQFVNRFYAYADPAFLNAKINPGDFNTIMPWSMYGKMTDEDLTAILEYLKTVKPVHNGVEKLKNHAVYSVVLRR